MVYLLNHKYEDFEGTVTSYLIITCHLFVTIMENNIFKVSLKSFYRGFEVDARIALHRRTKWCC